MQRGRAIALITLFVLVGYDFSVRPVRLVQSFKALRCCSEHCGKSGNMGEAERCCGIAQDQAGLRAVYPSGADVGAAAAAVLPGVVELPAPQLTERYAALGAEPSRGPPIFLAKQSFLL